MKREALSKILAATASVIAQMQQPLAVPDANINRFQYGGFGKRKNNFPQGKKCRARESKKYIPAGPRANVTGTYVKNPLVAENINHMHRKWLERYPEKATGKS